MDAQPALSSVRTWIIGEIKKILPAESSEIRSDTNGVVFQDWTAMTQKSLENTWIQEDTQRAINNIAAGKDPSLDLRYTKRAAYSIQRAKDLIEARKKSAEESLATSSGGKEFNIQSLVNKRVGVTTTCNAFLGVVVRKTLAAGGLANRVFQSFDLPKAGGNAWNWFPTPDKSPKPGDFFQVGIKGGRYEHVGIILDINAGTWSTAESGQGGPSIGYDIIKRKTKASYNIMGWIDADAYFDGWKGSIADVK